MTASRRALARFGPLVALSLLLTNPLEAQQPAIVLRLIALDGQATTLRADRLRALPQLEIRAPGRGDTVDVFRGPGLRAVLTLAGAPAGPDLRGANLTVVVVAEAADGYKVVYSLAELDNQFGARPAIVALTRDGKPLPDQDGPLQIVIAGEQHHARWIRQLVSLRLIRATE